MFLLLMLLEVFREAGVAAAKLHRSDANVDRRSDYRDAAIRAGLVSPSIVVVGAITAVSGVTLVNQSLSTIISILRLFFFAMGAFLGMFGIILGMIVLAAYLSRLQSFGVAYMGALSPPRFNSMLRSYLRVPWQFMKKRPLFLKPGDSDHQGDEKE
ncbi:spore germination protein [Cohnella faecalis]|uniref:spore germination protein n=1 Tax=Cohnella faecalis TaxID=2315694 RepID=UPI002278948C|nr:spore germination protein [Cohnella faecalis]